MSPPPRTLLLGYGNPGRQDDGLGPACAVAVERLGLSHVTVADPYQLGIEDAVDVAAHAVVWFVDASIDVAGGFAITPLIADPQPSFTSHATSAGTVLALAEAYYGARPAAFQLAIRGYAFELGEGLSESAAANLAGALAALEPRLRGMTAEAAA